jgi:hypothetical protein
VVGQHEVERIEQPAVGTGGLKHQHGGQPQQQRPVRPVEPVQQRQVIVAVMRGQDLVLGQQIGQATVGLDRGQ